MRFITVDTVNEGDHDALQSTGVSLLSGKTFSRWQELIKHLQTLFGKADGPI